jgi:hypothetical protein
MLADDQIGHSASDTRPPHLRFLRAHRQGPRCSCPRDKRDEIPLADVIRHMLLPIRARALDPQDTSTRIVLVHSLREGQHVTVLQLPSSQQPAGDVPSQAVTTTVDMQVPTQPKLHATADGLFR